MTLRPRSLAGQLALLVALALFAAQAINFALLLAERRERGFNGSVVPAITRVVDAAERLQDGDWRELDDLPARPARRIVISRRSRLGELAPVSSATARLRRELDAQGIDYRHAGVGEIEPPPGRPGRPRPAGRRLLVAAKLADGRWVSTRAALAGTPALGRLLVQTALIFALLLAGVLWIGRRAARPLAALTRAARSFGSGETPGPLAEEGPEDVRRLTAAFNAMETRITGMLREKDQMLGAIGHDLRTPLASLRVRVENLPDDSERGRMAATIVEMDRMLADILALARLGRSDEPAIMTDLAALADAVVEDHRDLGQPVSFAASDRLTVALRPQLVRRALRNLIDNAVHYGGSALVRVRMADARALVEVEDEGPGIPSEELEAMFEGFGRLEGSRSRETGGAGLGLTLARAVMRECGGDVALENRAEGGLRATLWLPLAEQAHG